MNDNIINKGLRFSVSNVSFAIEELLRYWESRGFVISKIEDELYIGQRHLGKKTLFGLPTKLELILTETTVTTKMTIEGEITNPIANRILWNKEIELSKYYIDKFLIENNKIDTKSIERYSHKMKKYINKMLLSIVFTFALLMISILGINLASEISNFFDEMIELSVIFGSMFFILLIIVTVIKRKTSTNRLAKTFINMQIRFYGQVIKPIKRK